MLGPVAKPCILAWLHGEVYHIDTQDVMNSLYIWINNYMLFYS